MNIVYISYLVSLRDDPVRHGGLRNISNITFRQETKEILPQYILHNSIPEEVSIFLNRGINEIVEFIHSVLVLSLSLKVAPGMLIVKNEKEESPPFIFLV